MFEIVNNEGQVIDTATSLTEAHHVVTYYMTRVRTESPYHCRPVAA